MTGHREWVFVSDLHLGGDHGDHGDRGIDEALPRFIETILRPGAEHQRSLVLLGDTFDLNGPTRLTDDALSERLTSLAHEHRTILAALGECVRSGTALHVVGGNHDIELMRPSAARLLTRLLGLEAEHPGVRFSPWILHEPGVFYAEHGNQHYGLNRIPTLLSVRTVADSSDLPVTPPGAASAPTSWCVGQGSRLVRVGRAVLASRRNERAASSASYQVLLDQEALTVGQDPLVLRDLARLSRFTLLGTAAGVASRVVERRLKRDRAGEVLATAAARVHATLTGFRTPVPAYIFGHNHRAERRDLLGSPAATYLNCGTWCHQVRGQGPDTHDRHLFPYVVVTAGSAGVTTDVRYWNASTDHEERTLPLHHRT